MLVYNESMNLDLDLNEVVALGPVKMVSEGPQKGTFLFEAMVRGGAVFPFALYTTKEAAESIQDQVLVALAALKGGRLIPTLKNAAVTSANDQSAA